LPIPKKKIEKKRNKSKKFWAEVAVTPKHKQNDTKKKRKNAMKTKIIIAAKKWEYEYCCSSFFLGRDWE